MKKKGLEPLIDSNTEILILGTMPGDVSLKTKQYYANRKNQFWKIIFELFNSGNIEYNYIKKTELLLKNKIGLWDVLRKSKRTGSLDSNISEEEFNDFKKIFAEFPKLRIIVFNGKTAANYFKENRAVFNDKEYYILPSTSSANTWKTFEQKLEKWKDVLNNTLLNNK